ncbi:MAG: hypothetical protein Q9205_007630 [Flavoplaca limonia]
MSQRRRRMTFGIIARTFNDNELLDRLRDHAMLARDRDRLVEAFQEYVRLKPLLNETSRKKHKNFVAAFEDVIVDMIEDLDTTTFI